LKGILFPGLPKLHLSATHLVALALTNIPHSGYISPEVMLALCALSDLRMLHLQFQSPQFLLDWESRSLPLPKRSILPALEKNYFKGAIEYLEDLVTFIDTPQLNSMRIYFFNQRDLDCPRLTQFINRTPMLRAPDETRLRFEEGTATVVLLSQSMTLEINILCRKSVRQLSSAAQVCNSSLHPLSSVEDLYIKLQYSQLVWENDTIENTL
jgi:hypothetical protein